MVLCVIMIIYQISMKSSINNYDEKSDEGYFLEVDIEYPKHYGNLIKSHQFYLKEKN